MIKQSFILLTAVLLNALPSGQAVAQTSCPVDVNDKEQACLKAKLEESFEAIRRAEDDIKEAISQWQQETMFITMLRKSLKEADERFWKYRDAQCGFAAALPAQGYDASRKIALLTCQITLNEQRAKELEHAFDTYAPIRFNRETRKVEYLSDDK